MTWLLAGAAAYAVLLAGMFAVMSQPPRRFGQFMRRFPMPLMMLIPFVPMWNLARRGRVEVGDDAPDFSLPTVDRTQVVRLASFRGERPVVLVFGSYT